MDTLSLSTISGILNSISLVTNDRFAKDIEKLVYEYANENGIVVEDHKYRYDTIPDGYNMSHKRIVVIKTDFYEVFIIRHLVSPPHENKFYINQIKLLTISSSCCTMHKSDKKYNSNLKECRVFSLINGLLNIYTKDKFADDLSVLNWSFHRDFPYTWSKEDDHYVYGNDFDKWIFTIHDTVKFEKMVAAIKYICALF